MDWNQRLHAVATALRLGRADIVRAIELGGGAATGSAVHAWLSAPDATKTGVRGQTLRKHREMPEGAFDAFLAGLRGLLDEIDRENGSDG